MKQLTRVVFSRLSRFLTRQILLGFVLLFCAAVLGALWNMSTLSSTLIQAQAMENARLYAQSIERARTLYSSDVVNRISGVPGITVTHNYGDKPGAIPLPATFLITLSHVLSEENNNLSVRLYSDYPFPWRRDTGGARDEFEREALKKLRQNSTEPFFRVETVEGRPSLRFAQADVMKASCVGCHDTHPDSPKRDWKVGDVRGVLEIVQPLDGFEAQTHQGLKGIFITLGGLSVIGLAGLAIALDRLRQHSRTLEHRVRERTHELAEANQEITALNHQLNDENRRMAAELSVTRQLQQMLLPQDEELSQIVGLDIAGYMEPTEEVGGDYYDVLQHNGSVKIGIGDVSGHGLESGVLMLMVQTVVRTLLTNQETDMVRFWDTLNRVILSNAQRMNCDKNVTLTLLDYQNNCISFSGQHEKLILVRTEGTIECIDTIDMGFPIGLVENITTFIAEGEIHLRPGDGIVLYTDGLTEAENSARELYGLERLCNVIRQHWEKSAKEVQQAILENVQGYIGNQKISDDIALLVLKQR
jgi:sigma-B regulation protein RsbU (phosphoserine phosphatase)